MSKLLCCIFGHKYYVIKRFSFTTRKVGCRRCGEMWGMNDRVKALIEWNGELEEWHCRRLWRRCKRMY